MHLKYDAIAKTKDQCSVLILRLRAHLNQACPRLQYMRKSTETVQAFGDEVQGEAGTWQRKTKELPVRERLQHPEAESSYWTLRTEK